MNYTLNLWDLVKKSGLPEHNIAAIRHSLSQPYFKKWYEKDQRNFSYFEEAQKINAPDYFHNKKYILSFVGGPSTTARFIGCYEDQGCQKFSGLSESERLPDFDYPTDEDAASWNGAYHQLVLTEHLRDLRGRLVIDWGKGTIGPIVIHRAAMEKKPVIAVAPDEGHIFPGYENVLWEFDKMAQYVSNPKIYEEICDALKAVNGVYLVTDPENGKFYVGSAYGPEGLYKRWLDYAVSNGTGGNQGLEKYLSEHPGQYKKLRYSILAVFYRTGIPDKDKALALKMERLYKQKLATVHTSWGLNEN